MPPQETVNAATRLYRYCDPLSPGERVVALALALGRALVAYPLPSVVLRRLIEVDQIDRPRHLNS